jgi:hypothetical protein
VRNKIATGRAIKGGVRFQHRGVRYKVRGPGIFRSIIREEDGAFVTQVQSFHETPREAVDRALRGEKLPPDHGRRWPKRRQGGRILSWNELGRRRYLGRRFS